jgi:phage-related protein
MTSWKLSCYSLSKDIAGSLSQNFGTAGELRASTCWAAARETSGRKTVEMRLSGREGIGRAIYTAAAGRRLILLHAFVKKTQKTPRSALNLALKRLQESGL